MAGSKSCIAEIGNCSIQVIRRIIDSSQEAIARATQKATHLLGSMTVINNQGQMPRRLLATERTSSFLCSNHAFILCKSDAVFRVQEPLTPFTLMFRNIFYKLITCMRLCSYLVSVPLIICSLLRQYFVSVIAIVSNIECFNGCGVLPTIGSCIGRKARPTRSLTSTLRLNLPRELASRLLQVTDSTCAHRITSFCNYTI